MHPSRSRLSPSQLVRSRGCLPPWFGCGSSPLPPLCAVVGTRSSWGCGVRGGAREPAMERRAHGRGARSGSRRHAAASGSGLRAHTGAKPVRWRLLCLVVALLLVTVAPVVFIVRHSGGPPIRVVTDASWYRRLDVGANSSTAAHDRDTDGCAHTQGASTVADSRGASHASPTLLLYTCT